MQNNFLIFLHLMAAVIAIGGSVYCLLIYLPRAEKDKKERDENSPSYKILDHLAPTVFASLLVLVGTGIYFLLVNYTAQTGLKPGYYNLFGIKMVFVAGAFFVSMYLTFSLRVQISDLDLNPKNKGLVPETLKKMIGLSRMVLALMTIALFLGVWLARF
ncbi:MAG: hypothetical protein F3743_07575 [Nitrospinae bacterium]|nr:hypothetical protein [Nitrospinota bacterium]MZH05246.1 hypothetical protein [Nitrospinota bacterium]MZH14381.1 hypothetical protein [Nitrospinota bacterium]